MIDEIPKGPYCYTIVEGKRVNCPFWSLNKDKSVQENGYCSKLNRGDWEIADSISLLWDQVKEEDCPVEPYPEEL